MHLSFTKIIIKNFKSFTSEHVLDFSFMHPGLTFVRGRNRAEPALGSNGAGKSTLWDALCWVLSGRTVSGLRNTDIKPWFAKGSTSVSLFFMLDESVHEISRKANPNKLMLDGVVVTQDQIDGLLGFGREVFLHTLLLGQGAPLFFDLTSSEKLRILSDVLNLHVWDDRSRAASERVKELEDRHRRVELSIAKLDRDVNHYKDLIRDQTKLKKGWDANRDDVLLELEESHKKIKKHFDTLSDKITENEQRADFALAEAKALESKFQKAMSDVFEVRDLLVQKEALVSSLKASKRELEHSIDDLGDVCPTCGQKLRGTDLEKHIKSVNTEIRKTKKSIKDAERVYTDTMEEYEAKDSAADTIRKSVQEFEKKAELLLKEVSLWRDSAMQDEVKLGVLNGQIKALAEEDNPYTKTVRKAKADLRESRKALEDKRDRSKKLSRRIDRTSFWIKGFKDLRLYILDEFLTELQFSINSMLPDIGLDCWDVGLSIEKETKSGTVKRGINITILSPNYREPVKWETWSGGERQRLRLIGSLALSEVLLSHAGITADLEIVDEPTQHLSEEGIDNLCDFLSDRASQLSRRIFYTDHHTLESSRFDNVLTVAKDRNNKSSIKIK